MDEVARERLAEIGALQQVLQIAWPGLKAYLELRLRENISKLVDANDEQTRGRIKELEELLGLPERLQQEAASLTTPLQQEGELP